MSRPARDWAWKTSTRGSARLLLFALADFADSGGWVWAQLPAMAERAGLGEATVKRQLPVLEAAGLVSVLRRRGRGVSLVCQVLLPGHDSRTAEVAHPELFMTKREAASRDRKEGPKTAQSATESVSNTAHGEPSSESKTAQPGVKNSSTTHSSPYIEPTTEPTTGVADAPPDEFTLLNPPPGKTLNGGQIATAWIDRYRADHPGNVETQRMKLQAAREARALIAAGNDPARVLTAAESAASKGYSTIEREFALLARNGTSRNGHRSYRDPADDSVYSEPFLPPNQEN